MKFKGKKRTPLDAIRTHCVICMGGSHDLVQGCGSNKCPLHPYRFRAISEGASRRLLAVIKTFCAECQVDSKSSACTMAAPYLQHDPCALWPYRTGKSPYRTKTMTDEQRARLAEQLAKARAERRGA